MNWYSLITTIKDILKNDTQVSVEVDEDSIIYAKPEKPPSVSEFPVIEIKRPSINNTSRRGAGDGDELYLTTWSVQIGVYVYDSIEVVDFNTLNRIERMIINALIQSTEFDEIESNSFYECEFVDYEPDIDTEKPYIGGTLTFNIKENYNTGIEVS